MTYQILHGNNLDILPTLADNSIDSIVTDPPYELGFMGKKWDSSGIAYSVELWQQCLRVLKPGGHLLSFGGTRTYHRMVVAIEDAGFEIRDMISWISNKTFPKSLDIGKAIDKGQGQNRDRQLAFTAWMRSTGITAKQIDEITQTKMGSHYTTHPTQPAIATAEIFDWLRPYLPEVPEGIERLVAERTGIEWTEYKNRKVIGQRQVPEGHAFASEKYGKSANTKEINETLAATPEAQQWQGWGTGLKPTVEPIVMARKPVEGTVANNVLTYGTGGLNIDASRIGTESITINTFDNGAKPWGDAVGEPYTSKQSEGRWPANVILDPDTAELLDEQSGTSKSVIRPPTGNAILDTGKGWNANSMTDLSTRGFADSGGASRFFYVAKASKRDRNEGLEELDDSGQHKWNGSVGHRGVGDYYPDGTPRPVNPMKNFHPTVKPTSLMEYLIKLVTPPNGTVLDPFTGSGSTGKAAILQGFDFIGIEMTEEYLPIIEGRLKHAEAMVAEAKEQDKAKENEVLF